MGILGPSAADLVLPSGASDQLEWTRDASPVLEVIINDRFN
jgi:hypothetical protein